MTAPVIQDVEQCFAAASVGGAVKVYPKNLRELLRNVINQLAVAGTEVPTGGTTGQVLAKVSNADADVEWIDSAGVTQLSWLAIAAGLTANAVIGNTLLVNLPADLQLANSDGIIYDPGYATLVAGGVHDSQFFALVAKSNGYAENELDFHFIAQAGDVLADGSPATPGVAYEYLTISSEVGDTTSAASQLFEIRLRRGPNVALSALAINAAHDVAFGKIASITDANLCIDGATGNAKFKGNIATSGGIPTASTGVYVELKVTTAMYPVGVFSYVENNIAAAGNDTAVVAVYGETAWKGAGALTYMAGFLADQLENSGGGTIGIAAGFFAQDVHGGSATLNAAFYAANQGNAATDWAFYSAGGKSHFDVLEINNAVSAGIAVASTNKVRMKIGGVNYDLLAVAV